MSTTLEKILTRRDEFDKELRQLEDEVSVLQERISITREKVKNIKTIEDAENFDNWHEKNFLDDGFQYIVVEERLMTVKQLKQALSNLNDNAIVTISQKDSGVAKTVGYYVGFNTETNDIEIDDTCVVIRDYKIIH